MWPDKCGYLWPDSFERLKWALFPFDYFSQYQKQSFKMLGLLAKLGEKNSDTSTLAPLNIKDKIIKENYKR